MCNSHPSYHPFDSKTFPHTAYIDTPTRIQIKELAANANLDKF